jgi:hypothetical protein
MPKGSLSFWSKAYLWTSNNASASCFTRLYLTPTIYLYIENYTVYLYDGVTNVYSFAATSNNVWAHYGLTWDFSAKIIKLYVNNVLKFTYEFTKIITEQCTFRFTCYTYVWASFSYTYDKFGTPVGVNYSSSGSTGYLDNFKLWSDTLTGFNHEYNDGVGLELGYSNVYSQANNYAPTAVKVGYYKTGAGSTYADWRVK